MGIIKSNTQRGDAHIFECTCGSHMIRIVKDKPWTSSAGHIWPPQHSIEFWEYRGDTSHTFWDRMKLGFRILFNREAKCATYDVLVNDDEVEELADAIRSLKD